MNNINIKDITTIASTYEPMYLQIKYQGERVLIDE